MLDLGQWTSTGQEQSAAAVRIDREEEHLHGFRWSVNPVVWAWNPARCLEAALCAGRAESDAASEEAISMRASERRESTRTGLVSEGIIPRKFPDYCSAGKDPAR